MKARDALQVLDVLEVRPYVNFVTHGGVMRFHRIEVDDEVMGYLKSKAEAFVDNPNSVLRRELLGMADKVAPPIPSNRPPVLYSDMPGRLLPLRSGTPQALRQILEVVQLSRNGSYLRSEATAVVAKALGVAPQTVLDKYCRQLGLTALKFDRLLEQSNLADLRALLGRKFPDHRELIEKALGADRKS